MIVAFCLLLKIEYNYKKEFKHKLKKYIKIHNINLIQNGKFLFLSKNLLFLVNLNEIGKKYDIYFLEKYINKLLNINL
jgi:type II restriction/modification system DNA methylase subunit YeeA